MITNKIRKIAVWCAFTALIWAGTLIPISLEVNAKTHKHVHKTSASKPTTKSKPAANIIHNSRTLSGFYDKLRSLQSGEPKVVTILHIGDSHIQAGFLTRTIRDGLQQRFGNAGRGLVFPYGVAKTHGPLDTKSQSNIPWKAQFSPSAIHNYPTGIMGISITSEHPDGTIDVWLVPRDSDDRTFTKVTVLHDRRENAFRLSLVNLNDNGTASSSEDDNPYASAFNVSPTNKIRLVTAKTDEPEHYAAIYGISLENGRSGILYHEAGVNGGSYASVNSSEYLGAHLSVLRPDLIVISLGTNDVNQKTFDTDTLGVEINKVLATVRNALPLSAILITTPGDFGKSRNKLVKERLRAARNIITRQCRDHSIAWWDFNGVMGGTYAIDTWRRQGLAQADMVHLNKAGYEAEGALFLSAFLDGYREHEHRVE
jgi:lysophospholipase L1-like esterase